VHNFAPPVTIAVFSVGEDVQRLQIPPQKHPGIKRYTATVWILTRLSMNSSSTGTSSLSSFRQEIWRFTASLTCSIVSSTVSPCEKHPGSAGTSAQKPPSSALWIKNRVFPGIFPYNHCANSSSVKPAFLIAALRSPILTVPETGMVSLPTGKGCSTGSYVALVKNTDVTTI
jgi:hypothetical protein